MLRHVLHRCVFAAIGLTLFAACETSKSSAPLGTARMTVTVIPADGTTPSVLITGPGSYSKTIWPRRLSRVSRTALIPSPLIQHSARIQSSALLLTPLLSPTARRPSRPVRLQTSLCSTRPEPTSAECRSATSSISTRMSSRPPSSASPTRRQYQPIRCKLVVHPGPDGLALDRNGNLWVDDVRSDTLRMFTPADRNSAGSKTPSRTLVSADVGAPWDIQFDPQGNLWVINCGSNYGTLAGIHTWPTRVRRRANRRIGCSRGSRLVLPARHCVGWQRQCLGDRLFAEPPAGIHCRPDVSRWHTTDRHHWLQQRIADQGLESHLRRQRKPVGSTGALGTIGGHALVEFTPGQLAAGGAPTPHTTITLPLSVDPYSMAFDRRGYLWVSDPFNNAVYAFTPAQLANGNAASAVTIRWQSPNYEPGQIVLDPYATPDHSAASSAQSRRRPALLANRPGTAGLRTVTLKPPPER